MAESTSLVPANLANGVLRQAGLLIGIAASVAVGVAVVLWSQTPNYSLLYGSLSDLDVSEIMETLQSAEIPFQLDHKSGAVLVPSDKVHEARIKLAAAGLPKTASTGFELLEKEPAFGSSQFAEQARYQRALEGELSRSIATMSNVRAARVHLAVPKQTVFARDKKDPSASVLVDLYPGRMLETGQVAAIVHLVAASVPNLPMSGVTVVDQQGRLLTRPEGSEEVVETTRRFDHTKRVEQSYIDRIKDILTPIVGAEGVKAQVTADMDFTQTEQTSESFNPDLPSVRSEQISEEEKSGSVEGGVPGALSNQPPGQASVPETTGSQAGGAQPATPRSARKQQTKNYELDKTISHSRMAVGALRRLSVAVVVNNRLTLDAEGKEARTALTPEELNRITSLVKEAIGFNPARGDTVNVINADFTVPPAAEPLPDLPIWQKPWFWDVVKQVLGAAFALFIALGVLRPALSGLVKKNESETPRLPSPSTDPNLPLGMTAAEAQAFSAGAGNAIESQGGAQPGAASPHPLAAIPKLGDLEAVRDYVKQEPKLSAQVIKGWLEAE
jgi:flagellar M-ring protein FliF